MYLSRNAFQDRLGLLTQRQMAEVLRTDATSLNNALCRGHLDRPSTKFGTGRREYYRLEDVPKILGQWTSYRASLEHPPLPEGGNTCTTCGRRPPREGLKQCERCATRGRNYHRLRTERGLCGCCGQPSQVGRTKCQSCADKARVTARRHDQKWRNRRNLKIDSECTSRSH